MAKRLCCFFEEIEVCGKATLSCWFTPRKPEVPFRYSQLTHLLERLSTYFHPMKKIKNKRKMRNERQKKWGGKRNVSFRFIFFAELSLFMIIAATSSLIWTQFVMALSSILVYQAAHLDICRFSHMNGCFCQPFILLKPTPKNRLWTNVLLSNMTWHTADIYEFIEH